MALQGHLALVKDTFQDRTFLRKAVMIALPVSLQGLMNTVINLVDTMMIGTLGATSIAAVGLANKVFFVFSLLVFGIVSGSGVLAAQYWGNQDVKNIRKVLGLALLLGIGGSLVFVFAGVLRPAWVMRIFTPSPQTIAEGSRYLRIVVFCYPFIALTNTYVAMLRAVNRVKAPVIISCATIVVNITLNYILIFGKLGMPAMGVEGAAWATLIARVFEACAVLLTVYIGRAPIACRLSEMFGYSAGFLSQFVRTTTPVIANEFMWGLGVTMYSLAYGRMGDEAVAAITIAQTIQDLMTVLFQGLSAATAVVLGNEMGAGHLDRAEKYAKNFFVLQFAATIVLGTLCAAIRWQFIGLYNVSPEVAMDVSLCLIMFVCFMPFKNFNYVNVVGVLRSGGDTKACLLLDTTGVWFIGIPLAFLGGLVWKLPIYTVYALVMLEEVYKMILGYLRYRSRKWLRNLAVEL